MAQHAFENFDSKVIGSEYTGATPAAPLLDYENLSIPLPNLNCAVAGLHIQPDIQLSCIKDVCVRNETGRLRKVILGRADTFGSGGSFEINCKTIQRAMDTGALPRVDQFDNEIVEYFRIKLGGELAMFKRLLELHGIEVIHAQAVQTQEQMFPRDPLIVIGNKIIVSRMKEKSRLKEFDGLHPLIDDSRSGFLITPPHDVFIEGGDVMVHHNTIYVGVGGPRTTRNAIQFLQREFADFNVVPLELAPAESDEDVLHLDCCLNFIGKKDVLIYPEGFKNPQEVASHLIDSEIIQVWHDEQKNFATNILSIGPKIIVSRPSTPAMNMLLREKGYEVYELEFKHVEMFGGSFRCATHPLWRDSSYE